MAEDNCYATRPTCATAEQVIDVAAQYELSVQTPTTAAEDGCSLGHSLLLREELLRQRRSNMDKHHHKEIWSKHPHGGAYYKANRPGNGVAASSCNDLQPASNCASDLTPSWVTLGYEVVKVGPTTNIVGDAMSNAATELVRAELSSKQLPGAGIDVHWSQRNSTCQLPTSGNELQQASVNNDVVEQTHRFRRLWARLESQGKTPQMFAV